MWLNFAGKATTAPRCSMKVVSMTLVLVGWDGAKNRDTMYGTLDMNDNLSARGARRQRRQSANGNATDKKGCRSTEVGAGRFSSRGQVSRMEDRVSGALERRIAGSSWRPPTKPAW